MSAITSSAPSRSGSRSLHSSAGNVQEKLPRLSRRKKWTFPHQLLFPIAFFYYEILLRLYGGFGLFQNLIYPLLFALAMGLCCSALTSVFSAKVNRILTMVLLYAIGLLFIVEILVYDSYTVYMTLGSILAGAGGVVGGFAESLFRAILHGLPVIFLSFLPAILYTAIGRQWIPAWHFSPLICGLMLSCALLIFTLGSLTASHGKASAKYSSQFNFDTATKTFGLLTSVRLNEKYTLFGNNANQGFVPEESSLQEPPLEEEPPQEPEETPAATIARPTASRGENSMDIDFAKLAEETDDEDLRDLHSYVAAQTPSKKNKYTGLFEGKNLILICAEAFSDVVINKELTPTLYRLAHNGFYFSDYYQPIWGGSTSTGEFSFLLGLAPQDGVETMLKTQHNNNYFTMGSQLQRLNYYSCSYHNGEYDFYDRNLTHKNLGYDNFLALGNGLEDISQWWPDDETLFDTTMDTYLDQQPFSIYYMTISGHCTYRSDKVYVSDHLSRVQEVLGTDRYKDTTMYYFCYQMELEDALTTMVQKLEEKGIADDTVICLTSDHYPYGLEKTETFGNSEDYVTDLYGYNYSTSWEKDHNTLIIWSGCLENENKDMACEISTPTYSLDILPTLSNLFGLTYDSRLMVGRDVFSEAEPLVLWSNYCWLTEKGKYDSDSDVFTPNEGYEVDEDYVSRMKQVVSNKMFFSRKAIYLDYYGVLFGDNPDE